MTWQACAALVEAGDPDRFRAAMTGPVEARARLFPLYAFNLEVAKAPWVTSEPALAEIRLQWWRDALDEVYGGGPVRRHEVVTPLAEVIRGARLPRPLFDALIDARGFDCYTEPHAGRASFDAYIAASAGNLMRLSVAALSEGARSDRAVADFGWGSGVANLLRGLPALYASGRQPIPVAGVLDRNALAEGRVPEGVRVAVREVATDALARIAAARRAGRQPRAAAPALRAGWRAEGILRAARDHPGEILAPRIPSEARARLALGLKTVLGRW
ncbi:MAG: squalene/phytoene synthase family protein [Pseudomonadota bacterium]